MYIFIQLFLACLYNLQAANILNDIDRDRIFSNICDVYKSNKVLWLDCMLPMVQKARDSKQPFQPSELHSGFTHVSTSSKMINATLKNICVKLMLMKMLSLF